MKAYSKAIAAVLGALATSLTAADLSSDWWWVPVITSVVTAGAVYLVPNAAPAAPAAPVTAPPAPPKETP